MVTESLTMLLGSRTEWNMTGATTVPGRLRSGSHRNRKKRHVSCRYVAGLTSGRSTSEDITANGGSVALGLGVGGTAVGVEGRLVWVGIANRQDGGGHRARGDGVPQHA